MTNIEKIQSERLAGEVYRLLAGDGSDAMLTAAVHDILEDVTGCSLPVPMDGSTPIIPTSDIQEAVSLMTAIDRRILTNYLTMLGMSPADLLRTLLANRIQGDPTHGIPSLIGSSLPTISSALLDRKISGVPEATDGISLVQLLGGAYNDVTELTDDNRGWTIRTDLINTLKSLFPNLTKLSLGFQTAGSRIGSNLSTITELTFPGFELQTDGHLLEGNIGVEDLTIPVVQIKSTGNWTQSLLHNNGTTKILRCTGLKYMTNNIGQAGLDSSKILVYDCNGIEEIYAEELEEFCSNPNGAGGIASGAPNLKKVVVGNIRIWHCQYAGPYFFDNYRGTTYDNLLHLEFKSLNCSLNLKNWTAANVISHQDFLPNFKTYIAERLADNGSGKTLTLSAAVFSSIWDANGNPQVLGDGLDQLRADIHRIVKTTKHWDVNKAS